METIKRIHPKLGFVRMFKKNGEVFYLLPDIARLFGYKDIRSLEAACCFKKETIENDIYMSEFDVKGIAAIFPDKERDEWLFDKTWGKGGVENMNEVKVFNNAEFGQVRTLEIEGKLHFVASDIAKALGYANPRDAILKHCRCVAKRDVPHPQSKSASIEVSVIPEGDVYRLIAHSNLPSAQKFETWVFDEVLPSIRKHGTYMTPEAVENFLANPDAMIKVLTEYKKEREARKAAESKLEIAAPKADYYDEVLQSKELLPITAIAKDYGWSSMKMNHYLENRKVQYKKGRQWFLYQNYADKGYTMSKTFTDGAYLNVQTYWTQKGRKFIYDLLASEEIFPVSVSSERMV